MAVAADGTTVGNHPMPGKAFALAIGHSGKLGDDLRLRDVQVARDLSPRRNAARGNAGNDVRQGLLGAIVAHRAVRHG